MGQSQVVVRVAPKLKRAFEKQCEALGLKPSETLRSLMLAFTRLEMRHRILTGEEPLTRDLTVSTYMTMSEKDRTELWENWYREAEASSENPEVAVKKIAGSRR
ncbi:MAG TPA: hypothetical protein VEC43_02195 [Candidatus Acidoferrales bacterium]|nr:hypothetical protein [Candidatus Acidoferrales bacterium]